MYEGARGEWDSVSTYTITEKSISSTVAFNHSPCRWFWHNLRARSFVRSFSCLKNDFIQSPNSPFPSVDSLFSSMLLSLMVSWSALAHSNAAAESLHSSTVMKLLQRPLAFKYVTCFFKSTDRKYCDAPTALNCEGKLPSETWESSSLVKRLHSLFDLHLNMQIPSIDSFFKYLSSSSFSLKDSFEPLSSFSPLTRPLCASCVYLLSSITQTLHFQGNRSHSEQRH